MTNAYNLKERFKQGNMEKEEDNGNFFVIKSLYNDIFNCGKSLALLRIIQPKVIFLNHLTKVLLIVNLDYDQWWDLSVI